MNMAAYTISREPVKWPLSIPHINNCEPVPKWQEVGAHEYVKRLADKRNRTVEQVLKQYPETSDVMCCDEYYVGQAEPLKRLVHDYEGLSGVVLGGGVWGPWRQRISDFFGCSAQWCDRWSLRLPCYHEMVDLYDRNIVIVPSVSGVHVFPIKAWEKAGYGVYDDTDLGTEITWFCKHSGVPVMLDLDAFFTRDKRFSIVKCIRCSVGLRTRLRRII